MIAILQTIALAAEITNCPNYAGTWSGRCIANSEVDTTSGPDTHLIQIRQNGCDRIELRTKTSVPATSNSEEYIILKPYSQIDLAENSTRLHASMARWFGDTAYLAISEQKFQTEALLDPYKVTTLFKTRFFHLTGDKLWINEESKAVTFQDRQIGLGWDVDEKLSQKSCFFNRSNDDQFEKLK